MSDLQKSEFDSLELNVDKTGLDFLREAAKWSYFLGIVGFVFIGIMFLFAIFAGSIFSSLGSVNPYAGLGVSSVFFTIYFIIIAAIYILPIYYLYNFGKKIKDAFKNNDSETLQQGLKNLKSHYKFVGILTAIILGIYALILVFGILGGAIGALAS